MRNNKSVYKTSKILSPLSSVNPITSWIIALLPTLGIIVFRPFLPAIAIQTPAAFHYPAVFLASWAGGFVPGILSTLILSIYSLFFIRPHLLGNPFADIPGLVRSLMFFSTSIMFVILVSALQRALKNATKALDSREHFLSNASHELRTPLTVLKLRLDVLKRRPDATAADLNVLYLQIDRLERLVSTMLNVGLSEDQQFKIHADQYDLTSIVSGVVSSMELYAHSVNSLITFDFHEPLFAIFDRTKIEQVITNILHNAIKYGNGGPVLVEMGTENSDVWVTIQDSGSGIAESNRKKLFLPYNRIQNKSAVEGMGLGLYLSKKIIELHSGTIAMSRSKMGGACFRISFPSEAPAK